MARTAALDAPPFSDDRTIGSLQRTATERSAELAAPDMSVDLPTAQEMFAEILALKRQIAEMGAPTAPAIQVTPTVVAASAHLLEQEQMTEAARLKAIWAAEPKVRIRLEPTPEEKESAARNTRDGKPGKYPPRWNQVNGVTYWIKVGEYVEVPISMAEHHERTQWEHPVNLTPAGEDQFGYHVGDGIPGF